jgi:hypothetical protein
MPKGLVRQFIVAMHKSIEAQNVWRSGVIICHGEYPHTRAEIIENYDKREIKIRVSGKSKHDLLTIVTYEFDKIHNSYKRLADKYQKLIPCNCSTCGGSQNPHFYEFANLKRRYANHKYTVECDISYESVNVLGLIDDIGVREMLYTHDYNTRSPQPTNQMNEPSNTTPPNPNNQEPDRENPWLMLIFVLAFLLIFGAVILTIAFVKNWWLIPISIVGSIIAFSFVQTYYQLYIRRLTQKNFLTLMLENFKRMTMIQTLFEALLNFFKSRPSDRDKK